MRIECGLIRFGRVRTTRRFLQSELNLDSMRIRSNAHTHMHSSGS